MAGKLAFDVPWQVLTSDFIPLEQQLEEQQQELVKQVMLIFTVES
jgi:hypothetical protein